MSTSAKKKRSRNFVGVGHIKVRWSKSADGRTFVDPRKYGRKVVTFTDHAEALREANRIAVEIHGGGAESLALSPEDRAEYFNSKRAAEKLGVSLTTALAQLTELHDLVAADVAAGNSLRAIVEAGAKALRRPVYPVPGIVSEFLKVKCTGKLDQRVERDFRKLLESFAQQFPGDIAKVEAGQIEAWLDARKRRDGEPLSAKRRNEILTIVRSLFKFARQRGRLPDVITAAGMVDRQKTEIGVVSFLTPAEMTTVLSIVDDAWIPWPVLVGFNGVRGEEVALAKSAAKRKDCLRWEDFDWHEWEICIRAEVAKTGHSRRIPIHPNTREWLRPWQNGERTGPVVPGGDRRGSLDRYREKFRDRIRELRKEREDITDRLLAWPSNVLRHSYGSYRMAIIGDMNRLAYEMGDSPDMIKRHYHNPRPRSAAKAWFEIQPAEHASQLILFPKSAKQA